MPIELNVNCEKRLIDFLSKAIDGLCVEEGSILSVQPVFDVLWEIDKILPNESSSSKRQAPKDSISRKLHNYIGNNPLFVFTGSMIRDRIMETCHRDKKADLLPLSSVSGFENTIEVAKDIIETLKSLPWLYRFRFNLPIDIATYLGEFLRDVDLSDDIKFIVDDKYKTTDDFNLLLSQWETAKTVLKLEAT